MKIYEKPEVEVVDFATEAIADNITGNEYDQTPGDL